MALLKACDGTPLDWSDKVRTLGPVAYPLKWDYIDLCRALQAGVQQALREQVTEEEIAWLIPQVKDGSRPQAFVQRIARAIATSETRLAARLKGGEKPPKPATGEDLIRDNEDAALWRLVAIKVAQRDFIFNCHVDGDGDHQGEAGTLGELLGLVCPRVPVQSSVVGASPATTFMAESGTPVGALLGPMAQWRRESGVGVDRGYTFEVYLPDTSTPARWVAEGGRGDRESFLGGSGAVDSRLAEYLWCVYAKPLEWGKTGRRIFLVGGFWAPTARTENLTLRRDGVDRLDPDSAFSGRSVPSKIAYGTVGMDGEVWEAIDP